MLASTVTRELLDAPNFKVWRDGVALEYHSPETILNRWRRGVGIEINCMKNSMPISKTAKQALPAYESGETLQIRYVNLLWPELDEIGKQLAQAANKKYHSVSALWSRENQQGCIAHHDGSIEVVVLHLQGIKKWFDLTPQQEEIQQIDLKPGDVLLVRPYYWHKCIPITDCMHLGVKLACV